MPFLVDDERMKETTFSFFYIVGQTKCCHCVKSKVSHEVSKGFWVKMFFQRLIWRNIKTVFFDLSMKESGKEKKVYFVVISVLN